MFKLDRTIWILLEINYLVIDKRLCFKYQVFVRKHCLTNQSFLLKKKTDSLIAFKWRWFPWFYNYILNPHGKSHIFWDWVFHWTSPLRIEMIFYAYFNFMLQTDHSIFSWPPGGGGGQLKAQLYLLITLVLEEASFWKFYETFLRCSHTNSK